MAIISPPATRPWPTPTAPWATTASCRRSPIPAPNYTISYVDGTLSVLPAALLVQAQDKSRAYGQTNPVFTASVSGFVNAEDNSVLGGALVFNTAADTNSPVGTYPIAVSGLVSTNYSITFSNTTLSVTPASLVGMADNKSRLYGQTNPLFTVTYTGFVNGQNAGIVSGALLSSTSANTNSPVGSYPISVSGQSAPNYTISYVDGTLSVLPAALLVQAQDKSRAYGQTNPVFTASVSGFVNAEDNSVLGGALVFNTAADTNSPVGTYPIAVSGLLSTNYSITFSNGTLTVTPFALTVTANNQSRTYGATNPVLTGTLTGAVNGDHITASYSTVADTNSPVANYSIVPALSDPDGKLANYSVTTTDGTLTVTQTLLAVTANN